MTDKNKKIEKEREEEKKNQALLGKSYKGPEHDPRREASENEGSEFIEKRPNEEDKKNDYDNLDYDKAKGQS